MWLAELQRRPGSPWKPRIRSWRRGTRSTSTAATSRCGAGSASGQIRLHCADRSTGRREELDDEEIIALLDELKQIGKKKKKGRNI